MLLLWCSIRRERILWFICWTNTRGNDNIFSPASFMVISPFSFYSKTAEQLVDTSDAYVNVLTRGDLSSLRWIKSPLSSAGQSVSTSSCRCSVYYSSLNFRDIMLATGKLPPDALPGNSSQLSSLCLHVMVIALSWSQKSLSLLSVAHYFYGHILPLFVHSNQTNMPHIWLLLFL